MALKLKRPEVAEKYESTVEKDITIHAGKYSGPLSNITLGGAQTIIDTKGTQLVEKKPAPVPKADKIAAAAAKE